MIGTITGGLSDEMIEEPNAENQGESQPELRTQNKGDQHSHNHDEQTTDHLCAEQSTQYLEDSQEEGGPPPPRRDT